MVPQIPPHQRKLLAGKVDLRRRSQSPRAAYGLPSGGRDWFPEFSAGRKAFGGALADYLSGERAEGSHIPSSKEIFHGQKC